MDGGADQRSAAARRVPAPRACDPHDAQADRRASRRRVALLGHQRADRGAARNLRASSRFGIRTGSDAAGCGWAGTCSRSRLGRCAPSRAGAISRPDRPPPDIDRSQSRSRRDAGGAAARTGGARADLNSRPSGLPARSRRPNLRGSGAEWPGNGNGQRQGQGTRTRLLPGAAGAPRSPPLSRRRDEPRRRRRNRREGGSFSRSTQR